LCAELIKGSSVAFLKPNTPAGDYWFLYIAIVRPLTGDSTFDLWKLLNWIFVGYYWAFLADLGQVAPTAYDRTVANNPLPVIYASTNNVFVNETLFNIYSIYIQETILPIIQMFDSDTSLFQ
jgi:hypothetical protein